MASLKAVQTELTSCMWWKVSQEGWMYAPSATDNRNSLILHLNDFPGESHLYT